MSGLQGKRILLGICGSIAAYKVAEWARMMTKEEAIVTTVMTEAASRFITPLTLATLTGNLVHQDMFNQEAEALMAHITLPRESDCILVAPATAQSLARFAAGMADTLLASTVLAARVPVLLCPAMNTAMLQHPATQANLALLRDYGYHLVPSGKGELACGEIGDGRLPDWDTVREALLTLFAPTDLSGYKILITAGPTREAIDPVRYLTNRSSGKMGYALVRTAKRRGAEVVLVSGPTNLSPPPGVELVRVNSAEEMAEAVFARASTARIIVKSAAVSDFKPKEYQAHKIKKKPQGLQLDLVKNRDILAELGKKRVPGQILVGFAAESQNHANEGQRKLLEKNVDMVVVNDILSEQTGFDVETNQVTLIDRQGAQALPLLSKEETADRIWDKAATLLQDITRC